MTQPEQTMDDSVRICPYCGFSYQPEAADYQDRDRAEECEGCGQTYIARDEFTVTHYAIPTTPSD